MAQRQSRLASYYTRAPSPTLDTVSPTRLTRTQPLHKLLGHVIDTKSKLYTLRSALHSKTSRYYATLSDTQDALAQTTLCARQLSTGSTLKNVSASLETCETVTNALSESRQQLRDLDGIRVSHLLLEASEDFISSVQTLSSELSLCTDPDTLYENLHLYAWRYSVILPVMKEMATPQFVEATSEMRKCAADACSLLVESNAEGGALTTTQSSKLRLLFGDNREDVMADFMHLLSKRMADHKPSDASLRNAPGAMAAYLYIQTFKRDVLRPLEAAYSDFLELFGEEGVVMWIGDVLEDCLVARVRGSLHNIFSSEKGLDDFRNATGALSAEGVVGKILGASKEGLDSLLMERGRGEIRSAWKPVVDEILSGNSGDWETMMVTLEKGKWLGIDLEGIGEDIINYCSSSTQHFEHTARTCVVLRKLSRPTSQYESKAVSHALDSILTLFRESDDSDLVAVEVRKAFALADSCSVDGLRRGGGLMDGGFGLKLMRGFREIIRGGEKDADLPGGKLERFARGVGECVGVDGAVEALLTAVRDRGG